MKTWQRILIVVIVLILGVAVGLNKVLERARDNGFNALSVSNLKMIGIALMMYADDYNNILPDLSDAQNMKKAVAAYVSTDKSKTEKHFVHPRTGKPYQPNSSLSYKELKGPNASADIAVVYEDALPEDGTRAVLFGDGHVERVDNARWLELKKTSNIP
jgi:prepilin-type processing-associated H-X9-DG protein